MKEVEAALIKFAVQQLMLKLVSTLSFLSLPVINPIVTYFVTKLVTWMVQETALGLSLLWITLNISYEVESVDKATAALKKMLENSKDYSKEQMDAISKNFDDAADKLISLAAAKLQ